MERWPGVEIQEKVGLFGTAALVRRVERRVGSNGPYARLTVELEGGDARRVFFAPTEDAEEDVPCLYEFVERGIVRDGTRLLFHYPPDDNQWYRWRGYRDRYGFWRRGPSVTVNVDRLVPVYASVPFCRLKEFITGRLGVREERTERSAMGIARHRILQRHWKLLWDHLSSGEGPERSLAEAREGTEDFIEVLANQLDMSDLWEQVSSTLSTCEEISDEIMEWTGEDGYFCSEYRVLSNRLGFIGRADFIGVRRKGGSKGRIIEYKITDNMANYESSRSWGSVRALLQAATYSRMLEESAKLPQVDAEVWVFDKWSGKRSYTHPCQEDDLENMLKRALWARDEYLFSVSSPTPPLSEYGKGKCRSCSFKRICKGLASYQPDPFFTEVRRGLDLESEANSRVWRPMEEGSDHALVIPGRNIRKYGGDSLELSVPEDKQRVVPSSGSFIRISPVDSTHGWSYGVVEELDGDVLEIKLKDPLTPPILTENRIRLDFSVPFDFSKRAKMAITSVEAPEIVSDDPEVIDNLKQLRDAVSCASSMDMEEIEGGFGDLNDSQREAAGRMMESKLTVIHGPFGSGKTTVIARACLEIARKGGKVLVTSYTNNAVDNAMSMIRDFSSRKREKISQVRVGAKERTEEGEGIRVVDTRDFDGQDIRALREAHVVGSTLISCMSDVFREAYMDSEGYVKLRQLPFDVCVVDEASQCILPYALIPCLLSRRWVLVGDHKQLEPLILDPQAGRALTSWFDMAVQDLEESGEVVMLDIQYRCPHEVGSYLSSQFYGSRLRNDGTPEGHDHQPLDIDMESWAGKMSSELGRGGSEASVSKVDLSKILDPSNHLIFIDTAGRSPETGRRSKSNAGEATICSHLLEIFSQVTDDLLFLSPYQAQNSMVRRMVGEGIRMGTVDSYQGRQADVVILSLVRSNRKGILGFLRNVRRLNVAMSRCKKKLIVVSDSTTIKMNRADLKAREALMEYIRTSKDLDTYVSLAPEDGEVRTRTKRRELRPKRSLRRKSP